MFCSKTGSSSGDTATPGKPLCPSPRKRRPPLSLPDVEAWDCSGAPSWEASVITSCTTPTAPSLSAGSDVILSAFDVHNECLHVQYSLVQPDALISTGESEEAFNLPETFGSKVYQKRGFREIKPKFNVPWKQIFYLRFR